MGWDMGYGIEPLLELCSIIKIVKFRSLLPYTIDVYTVVRYEGWDGTMMLRIPYSISVIPYNVGALFRL